MSLFITKYIIFIYYLRLSIAIQTGNAISIRGTLSLDSDSEPSCSSLLLGLLSEQNLSTFPYLILWIFVRLVFADFAFNAF